MTTTIGKRLIQHAASLTAAVAMIAGGVVAGMAAAAAPLGFGLACRLLHPVGTGALHGPGGPARRGPRHRQLHRPA